MVEEISSKKDFDKVLLDKDHKLVVVDFFAKWCGPCKVLSPKFDLLAEKMKKESSVKFIKVDIDDATEITNVCDINAVPTIFFYKNAECIEELRGPNIDAIINVIKKNI